VPKDWDFHVIAKKPSSTLSFQHTVAMLDGLFDKFAKIAVAAPAAISQSHLV